MTGTQEWPVRPPDAPAFVPYGEAPPEGVDEVEPLEADAPPADKQKDDSATSIVALAIALAIATGAIGLLVLGLVSSIGTGGGSDDDSFGPPGAPIPAPTTVATAAPTVPRRSTVQACKLVSLEEASVVLGAPAVTVVPAVQVSPSAPTSCGFSVQGKPGPSVPHLQVFIADSVQYSAAKGSASGTDTFTSEVPAALPRTIEVGLLRDGQAVLVQVVGSRLTDGGADAASTLAELAHGRL